MTDWKPTEEMVQTGAVLLRHWFGNTTHFPAQESAKFLIAVQPWIAKQERERCARLEHQFISAAAMAAAIRAMGEKEPQP